MRPRSTRPSSRNCCRRRGITSNDMRTIQSRTITASSSTGIDRCVGCTRIGSKQVIVAGHAFMQNLRRGHHEMAAEVPAAGRVAVAFTALALAI